MQCTSLESITIPDSVTSIGYGAFSDCYSLTSIIIENPECEIYSSDYTIANGYSEESNYYFNGTIYGYAGSTAQVYAEQFDRNFVAVDGNSEATNEILTQTTSLSHHTTYLSTEAQTAEYSDIIPSEVYNFYVLKTSNTETPLSSENLLYVTQGIADEYGNLTISYIPKEEYADAVLILAGMTRIDISDAYVEVTDLEYTGEEQSPQVTVYFGDEILTEGEDYDIASDFSATDAGLYEITIVGTGEYTGETTAQYRINASYMTGDISGNNMIDLYDAIEICKYIMGMRDFTEEELIIADYDYSGKVDLYDVIAIASKLLE